MTIQRPTRARRPITEASNAADLRLLTRVQQLEDELAATEARCELIAEHYVSAWVAKQRSLTGRWTTMDERRAVVAYVEFWVTNFGVRRQRILTWIGISESKFFNWKRQVVHELYDEAENDAAQ